MNRRMAGAGGMRRNIRGSVAASGGAAPESTPATILGSDGKVWLRSDLGFTDGSSWTDQSGSNNTPTQGTADNRPTLVANQIDGHAIVRFDGTNDMLTLATGFAGIAATTKPRIYVVGSTGTAADVFVDLSDGATTNRGAWIGRNTLATADMQLGTDPGTNVAATFDDADETDFKLYSMSVDSSDRCELRLNNTVVGVSAVKAGGLTYTMDRMTVGARVDGTRPLVGDIAEIVVCYATDQQHDDLIAYFAARYPSLGLS